MNDKEDFNYKSFALNTTVGAATGVITGGAGAIGSQVALNVAKTATTEAIIITTSSAIGGAVSGGVQTVVNNKTEGRDAFEGVGVSAVIGGLSGGIASGIG